MIVSEPAWRDLRVLARAAPFMFLVLLAAALSYRYHVLLRDQRDRVEHTDQVIEQLQTTLVAMIDAETGQRGDVLTGDERDLTPYRQAVDAIPASLALLRRRVDDRASQVARVDALQRLVQDKFDELRSTVTARQTAGFDAARAIVLGDRGRSTMDALRSLIGEMQGGELALLDERSAAAHDTERRLLIMTVACAALSLIARAGLALTMRAREVR